MLEFDSWSRLKVFENKVRIEVIQLLLTYEIMSLSEICRKLRENYNRKMTLPGLLKHIRELENYGIIRQESGGFLDSPDARKTVYILQGKERVKTILQSWTELTKKLGANKTFSELMQVARMLFVTGTTPQAKEIEAFGTLLRKCESEEVYCHLTEDERKKLKLWKMMFSALRQTL
jgi:hypothetical protein